MLASRWVERFAPLVKESASVLDLACGGGRHGRLFLKAGHQVRFVDKNIEAVGDLSGKSGAQITQMDLEDGKDWPFAPDSFDAIVVTNYLYRAHLGAMLTSLKQDGVLIYETFGLGNDQFGRPRSPDFLLKPGELLKLVEGQLQVVAYEQGIEGEKVVQRICAIKAQGPQSLQSLL
ncbi:conserved hypothetical protein [Candidatus Terasakiella magnetica]|uniref:Methyltransferase domain-containing protein n=1 Tax=Candidatus Terasakiella magnetica TaxID=1867952 RepID=A0A1C3RJH9_9PROT|nr:class I SAM-dependent methyltransferase [Candidatus Terasakiella magnetica]SCA57432.1 conserved hypothetical protein [Candidatus Terasakiella magnetica]